MVFPRDATLSMVLVGVDAPTGEKKESSAANKKVATKPAPSPFKKWPQGGSPCDLLALLFAETDAPNRGQLRHRRPLPRRWAPRTGSGTARRHLQRRHTPRRPLAGAANAKEAMTHTHTKRSYSPESERVSCNSTSTSSLGSAHPSGHEGGTARQGDAGPSHLQTQQREAQRAEASPEVLHKTACTRDEIVVARPATLHPRTIASTAGSSET